MSSLRVDVTLRRGEFELRCRHEFPSGISAVTGASGAGKSSLFDALCGDENFDGAVHLGDETLVDTARNIHTVTHRRAFRRAYQDARLFPHLDVEGNVFFGARRGQRRLDASEVFDSLEIGTLLHRDCGSLSGGERQRVAIARALFAEPLRALLFDESLSAVDRPLRRRILLALRRWQQRLDVPLLYACHDAEEALLVAEHCIALERGAISATGSPSHVLGSDETGEHARVLLLTRVASHRPDVGLSELQWGDQIIEAPLFAVEEGESVVVELAARDVVICSEEPRATSARNRLRATLERLQGGVAPLHIAHFRVAASPPDAPKILGCVTQSAIGELGLTEGREYWLLFKSSALRIL